MTTTTTTLPGAIAPADGSATAAPNVAPGFSPASASIAADGAALKGGATPAPPYGPNNERLEELKPRVVAALRDLVLQYRLEGIVARRHEIRRIRQARLFWQGLQYAWWSPQDMNWHLPTETGTLGLAVSDDRALEEMPRYQFVTNFYQGFGLSFIAVMSQDVPSVRFYPQSAQNEADIAAAKAASEAAKLIEQNNRVPQLLTGVGYYLWTDGKIGGYVRYVADGQRFGFHDEDILGTREIQIESERITVPHVVETRRVPNGQEVLTIVGGLELNTPVWANEMHEYPYLQWQMEVHRAKLRASYPHAAEKIQMGGPETSDDVYARASRIAVAQGLPTVHPGDALYNLVTFARTWIRPWAFYALDDKEVRDELLQLFPDGCYAAFAGETYCEARNETMDDHWRVMHALPGDGQNRPSVGDSLVQVQERYNTLSNIQTETYEFGIPPIYADPQVLDFDALQNQVAEPAAHYPARAKTGQPLAAGFFQPAPAQVPPDMLRHQQDLVGPVAQFLTGLFPAVFGGEMKDVKTAAGYSMARDQALGRLGLVWRRLKTFYADLMLLGVDCFRKNRPEDLEIPFLGEDGAFESKWIRLADLKGNIQAYPESDETFPRLKSQQRAVVQTLMTSNDPLIQRALADPANINFLKNVIGLNELVVPGEAARSKQLREIQQLLASAPIVVPSAPPNFVIPRESAPAGDRGISLHLPSSVSNGDSSLCPAPQDSARNDMGAARTSLGGQGLSPGISAGAREGALAPEAHELVLPSVPVDVLLDDHSAEFEECRRWASSDAGQAARVQNPAGFANVRAHAAAHFRALQSQQAQQGMQGRSSQS